MVYSHGGARLRPMAQPSQSAFGTITYSMLYSLCRCTISATHHSTHYNTAIHQSTILSQLYDVCTLYFRYTLCLAQGSVSQGSVSQGNLSQGLTVLFMFTY